MSRSARAFFLRLVENLSHDLRISVRMLRRESKFAASAILPLALGMAAAMAVYSVAYGILLRPLPVRDEGSLAVVYAGDRVRDDAPISYPRFRAWQASGVFEGLASVSTRSFDIVIDGLAERVPAEAVTGDFFAVLGVSTIRGRVLTPGEGRHGGDVPAVISHALWARRFGAEAAALNQTVRAGPTRERDPHMRFTPPALELSVRASRASGRAALLSNPRHACARRKGVQRSGFAAWLREQISDVAEAGFTLSEPIQEDYGWGFWATKGKDPFWIALGFCGEGPTEEPGEWNVSVNYDPGLNVMKRLFHKPDMEARALVQERIARALRSTPGIRVGEEEIAE